MINDPWSSPRLTKEDYLRAYHGTLRLAAANPDDFFIQRNLMYDMQLMEQLGYIACAQIGTFLKKRAVK